MCFDFMYFVGAQDHDEWWWEWSPAWRFVGTHTHWNAKLQRIAVEYIQKALGVEEDGVTIPPVSFLSSMFGICSIKLLFF